MRVYGGGTALGRARGDLPRGGDVYRPRDYGSDQCDHRRQGCVYGVYHYRGFSRYAGDRAADSARIIQFAIREAAAAGAASALLRSVGAPGCTGRGAGAARRGWCATGSRAIAGCGGGIDRGMFSARLCQSVARATSRGDSGRSFSGGGGLALVGCGAGIPRISARQHHGDQWLYSSGGRQLPAEDRSALADGGNPGRVAGDAEQWWGLLFRRSAAEAGLYG